MTADDVVGLGEEFTRFFGEFRDCLGRKETGAKMEIYLRGQLGDLPRKNCEPIALAAGIRPRSLQEFLASDVWDEDHANRIATGIVVRDHNDELGIAIIDESGHPKKGDQTAGVQRQYCGRSGKVDNCVTTVHLVYAGFCNNFHTMLHSDLYLPESWNDDRDRCRAAKIPDSLVYRPKYEIALEQVDRALAAGVSVGWITADEWYGTKPKFVRGLEQRGQRYVLEVPGNFEVWLRDPAQCDKDYTSKPVANLANYSHILMRQPWERYHIKDTDKGPMVWEVKAAPCWLPDRTGDSGAVGPCWLIVARNVLSPNEIKYFISNAGAGVPLSVLLHVAFRRWLVERCLQSEKSELGLSQFEARVYPAIKRHLILTQLSHLYLARETQRLRGEKRGGDSAAIASSHQHRAANPKLATSDASAGHRQAGRQAELLPTPQRRSPPGPHQDSPSKARGPQHRPRPTHSLPSRLT